MKLEHQKRTDAPRRPIWLILDYVVFTWLFRWTVGNEALTMRLEIQYRPLAGYAVWHVTNEWNSHPLLREFFFELLFCTLDIDTPEHFCHWRRRPNSRNTFLLGALVSVHFAHLFYSGVVCYCFKQSRELCLGDNRATRTTRCPAFRWGNLVSNLNG